AADAGAAQAAAPPEAGRPAGAAREAEAPARRGEAAGAQVTAEAGAARQADGAGPGGRHLARDLRRPGVEFVHAGDHLPAVGGSGPAQAARAGDAAVEAAAPR